jgi:hypothetical protein
METVMPDTISARAPKLTRFDPLTTGASGATLLGVAIVIVTGKVTRTCPSVAVLSSVPAFCEQPASNAVTNKRSA